MGLLNHRVGIDRGGNFIYYLSCRDIYIIYSLHVRMRHSDPSRNRKRAYEYFQRIAWHVERRGHVRVDLNVSLFIWKVFFPSLEPRSPPPPPSLSLPTFSFLFFYSLFFLFCSPLISKRRNWHEVNAQGRCLIKCQPSRHIISTTPPCPISFTNFKIELSLSWMDFVNKKLEEQGGRRGVVDRWVLGCSI